MNVRQHARRPVIVAAGMLAFAACNRDPTVDDPAVTRIPVTPAHTIAPCSPEVGGPGCGPFGVSSPDDTVQVECNPSPVLRGQGVRCAVTLKAGYHLTAMNSGGFVVRMLRPLAGSDTLADPSSARVITTGVFTDSTQWADSGKAVFSTWLNFHVMVADTSGRTYTFDRGGRFVVSYSVQSAFSWPTMAAESIGALPDKEAPIYDTNGNLRIKKTFAVTTRPMLESGAANELAVYLLFERPLGNIQVDSATSGPDSGYKYVSSALSLTTPISPTSLSLYGSTAWDNAQVGRIVRTGKPDSTVADNGLPFCNKNTMLSLWTDLASKVRRHEGVSTGEVSHVSIWSDAINSTNEHLVLQHMFFPNVVPAGQMRLAMEMKLLSDLPATGAVARHQSLDDALPGQLDATLACGFDNGWRFR